MTSPAQARANAAQALSQIVHQGRTIDRVEHGGSNLLTAPLTTELVYGSCRHFFSINELVSRHLDKPLRNKDREVFCLMLVGAYQLQWTRIKTHAVINETVQACNLIKRSWAKGLVNAVLRKVSSANTDQSFELPIWLLTRLRTEYAQAEELLRANLERAPMCLRINAKTTTAEAYKQTLLDQAIEFESFEEPCALRLQTPMAATDLPFWQEGYVAIQDYGAQLVATIACQVVQLYAEPRVLDACAAPGGKLFHLLEQYPDTFTHELVALEAVESRAAATVGIGERLNHQQKITVGDATLKDWWDGQPFDFILLDAPCSGTGTLRRHPDIKVLLQEEDIAKHAELQLQLVDNLWSTLAPGGTLLYCTCSLLAAENDEVIGNFLASQPTLAAEVLPVTNFLALSSGQATRFGWQLLPTDANTDGFYMSVIKKAALPGAPTDAPQEHA